VIAFAVCIGSRETYERHCRPGLAAHGGPDSPLAEIETDSIFSGYNEALDAFAPYPDLEALVLLHEDVAIHDPDLGAKIRRRLTDPSIAVIGAIGARRVRSLCWWEGEMHGRVSESRGLIDHGGGCHDVDTVDGLLMVLSPWAVRTLRFDESRFHGFHGYDVDFCLQAGASGRRVVVDDLLVHHHTRGGIGDGASFWRADQTLRRKWSELGREMAGDEEMRADTRAFAVAERR
jgi:Glycosyltransferase like family